MSYKNMTLVKPDEASYIVSNAQFSIARPHESGLELSITKDQFLAAVNQELTVSPYVPAKHNGLRNPYTGKIVTSVADYEEYIREYTFHRLCEEGTVAAYNARITAELRRANARHEEAQSRTRLKYRLLAVFLCMALVSSFIYIGISSKPAETKDNDSYNAGYSAGLSDAQSGDGSTNGALSDTTVVYITRSGSKYHTKDCSYLRGSSIPISLSEAKSEGYGPCSRCHPPR